MWFFVPQKDKIVVNIKHELHQFSRISERKPVLLTKEESHFLLFCYVILRASEGRVCGYFSDTNFTNLHEFLNAKSFWRRKNLISYSFVMWFFVPQNDKFVVIFLPQIKRIERIFTDFLINLFFLISLIT